MDKQALLAGALKHIRYEDASDKSVAFVTSSKKPCDDYRTSLVDKTCECGMVVIRGELPCKHLYFPAESVGMDPDDLVPAMHTTERWREQYPLDVDYEVPSSTEIHAMGLRDDNIALPLVTRRAKGRPAMKRKKSWTEGGGGSRKKNAPGRCGNCGKTGHNQRTCKFMPSQKKQKKK
jgi:hypothetical protein